MSIEGAGPGVSEPIGSSDSGPSGLIDRMLPEDDPRQIFFSNLRTGGECMVWLTPEANAADLAVYVLGQLGISPGRLMHAREGFAQTTDESLLITLVQAPGGAAMAVWPLADEGASLVNRAANAEFEQMRQQLLAGEYKGNPLGTQKVQLANGVAETGSASAAHVAEFYRIANECSVVRLDGFEPVT